MIEFTVIGTPAPQGSKNRWGTEDNPRTRPWRAAVAAEAAAAMGGRPLLTGPLRLEAAFVFPRPASHYGSGRNASVLKTAAPYYVAKAPDLDKLIRAIGDALTGVAIRDDALIAELITRKTFGTHASARVFITELAARMHWKEAAA